MVELIFFDACHICWQFVGEFAGWALTSVRGFLSWRVVFMVRFGDI